MDGFLKQLDGVNKLAKNQRRERVLIIFSDEEWDVKNLANAFGSGKETVIKYISLKFFVFAYLPTKKRTKKIVWKNF